MKSRVAISENGERKYSDIQDIQIYKAKYIFILNWLKKVIKKDKSKIISCLKPVLVSDNVISRKVS